jgi:hypothetical protein
MLKFVIKILIGFLTISIGVSAAFLWNLFTTLPQVEVKENQIISEKFKPIEITACQVLDIPTSYDGKLVSIEATAYVNSNRVILFPNKNCYEPLSDDFQLIFPVLDLKGFTGNNNNLKSSLESLALASSEAKEVDLRVIGLVKRFYDKDKKLQYSILPTTIELLTPIRKFEVKGAA